MALLQSISGWVAVSEAEVEFQLQEQVETLKRGCIRAEAGWPSKIPIPPTRRHTVIARPTVCLVLRAIS